VTFAGGRPGIAQQVARDHSLLHPQHRRDQLGLRGQQHAQRDLQSFFTELFDAQAA
jgi:hypothetical protein